MLDITQRTYVATVAYDFVVTLTTYAAKPVPRHKRWPPPANVNKTELPFSGH